MADMALFCVGSVLQFFVDSAWQLFLVRLLMGIAIGAEYSVGWPLMSEFAPARLRGRLICVTEVAWYVGFMVAFLVGYVLTTTTDVGWRVILGSSTFIAVVLFLARLGLPESPRWLWNKGRHDEARAIAHKYMTNSADMTDVEHEDTRKGSFGMLFSRQYWRATLFTSGFWFCAVAPYFAIATFADSVLKSYGLSGGLAGGLGLSALAAAGVVVTVLLIDRVGRRVLTVPPQWLCTVVLAVIGLWAGAPPLVVLALFLVFSFFNAMYTALTGLYPAEVFPTEIRGIGTGFAAAVSRVGAGLGTFLLPWSMTNLGVRTDHADRRRHRRCRCRIVAVAGPRNKGEEPHRDGRRNGALAGVSFAPKVAPIQVKWPQDDAVTAATSPRSARPLPTSVHAEEGALDPADRAFPDRNP